MRLHITDKKDEVVFFLFEYLSEKINNVEIKIILNGKELIGKVEHIAFDEEAFNWINLYIQEETFQIPIDEGTKVRFDRELFYFETQSHTTLIYIN